jgi:hypothetical protein
MVISILATAYESSVITLHMQHQKSKKSSQKTAGGILLRYIVDILSPRVVHSGGSHRSCTRHQPILTETKEQSHISELSFSKPQKELHNRMSRYQTM